jgi:5-methylcytosine-specific restriction enzyme B
MRVREFEITQSSLEELITEIRDTINQETEDIIPDIEPKPDLYGIPDSVYSQITAAFRTGKRHLILYGPPGTGKTTLAQYIAQELSSSGEYEMLTASSSWTSQELIGGYQPIGGGKIGFVPGIILRNFDRPIVIDELNRCPIDKVIGPLFSVLSGQATTLPYKLNLEDSDSPFHVIFPGVKENPEKNEWFPTKDWRLIATLNTVDKSQLGQLSYALSRRFAWIKIGVPENLREFILHFLGRKGETTLPNPIADMWHEINKIRQIGGAPIIDFIKTIKELDPGLDLLTQPDEHYQSLLLTALGMYILPLLDGIRKSEAEEFIKNISDCWGLGENKKETLRLELNDIIV